MTHFLMRCCGVACLLAMIGGGSVDAADTPTTLYSGAQAVYPKKAANEWQELKPGIGRELFVVRGPLVNNVMQSDGETLERYGTDGHISWSVTLPSLTRCQAQPGGYIFKVRRVLPTGDEGALVASRCRTYSGANREWTGVDRIGSSGEILHSRFEGGGSTETRYAPAPTQDDSLELSDMALDSQGGYYLLSTYLIFANEPAWSGRFYVLRRVTGDGQVLWRQVHSTLDDYLTLLPISASVSDGITVLGGGTRGLRVSAGPDPHKSLRFDRYSAQGHLLARTPIEAAGREIITVSHNAYGVAVTSTDSYESLLIDRFDLEGRLVYSRTAAKPTYVQRKHAEAAADSEKRDKPVWRRWSPKYVMPGAFGTTLVHLEGWSQNPQTGVGERDSSLLLYGTDRQEPQRKSYSRSGGGKRCAGFGLDDGYTPPWTTEPSPYVVLPSTGNFLVPTSESSPKYRSNECSSYVKGRAEISPTLSVVSNHLKMITYTVPSVNP